MVFAIFPSYRSYEISENLPHFINCHLETNTHICTQLPRDNGASNAKLPVFIEFSYCVFSPLIAYYQFIKEKKCLLHPKALKFTGIAGI